MVNFPFKLRKTCSYSLICVLTELALFSRQHCTKQPLPQSSMSDNILTFPLELPSHIMQDLALIIVLQLAGCYSDTTTNRTLRQVGLLNGKHLTLERKGELWQPASYRNCFITPGYKELSQFVTVFDRV